eukprot:CAMPEP_0196781526 /NCGR_PEP_ID=MMETSP1104-20130614/9696_1 /TAXON_ID=33652 /ORGANISM="Cafeteria sp., Strain Caron Lab Isolate" /LENGTH=158 /DNA_ID=CAMNT_0042151759 /DNA_START=6 /DNA_END=478 /DNA_ORIENTATION=+
MMDACPAARGLGVLAWLSIVLTWILQGAKSTPSTKSAGTFLKDRFTDSAVYLFATVLVVTLIVIFKPRLEWICIVGGAMTVAGAMLAVWARLYMGKWWSSCITLKKDHKLIRSGPFSLVRHPIYAGVVFATIGSIMQSQTLIGLATGVIVIVLLLFKL